MSQYIKQFGLAAIVATGLAFGTLAAAPAPVAAESLSNTIVRADGRYVCIREDAPYTDVSVCFPVSD
jgi:hypothetical protein